MFSLFCLRFALECFHCFVGGSGSVFIVLSMDLASVLMVLSVVLAGFPSPVYDCFLNCSLFCLWFWLRLHCFAYGFDLFPNGFVSGVGLFSFSRL